ncbi:hypothetical protein FACS1894176_02400 [Bacteroidia bacterium]|nr:hypothetical protein FACS1894176_02400 [Bacteroidia bacterium]
MFSFISVLYNMNIYIKSAKEFALNEIEKYGLPTLVNFELSEQKAIELVHKLNANETIVTLGVYLMDCKLGQAFSEKRVTEHVQMSVEASEEFLKQFDLTRDDKAKILNCVAAHHGTVPYSCIEAEICANADCYRFISPKGVF